MSKSEIVIIEREVQGKLGHTIKPGDVVFTFTSTYGGGTRVSRGVFLGVREKPVTRGWNAGRVDTTYAVRREDGTRTFLNYPGMVPHGTSLDVLHDRII